MVAQQIAIQNDKVYEISSNKLIYMQHSERNHCSTRDCNKKVQAACLTCEKLKCFNCSIIHAKQYPDHRVDQIDGAMIIINKQCQEYISQLDMQSRSAKEKAQVESIKKKKGNQQKKEQQKMNPQKFQEQLNYISSMQKETIKIVEKFFSQLSLELVNIWENYLNKYSNIQSTLESVNALRKKIESFSDLATRTQEKAETLSKYFQQNFQELVSECEKNLSRNFTSEADTPICPDMVIDEKMLIAVSELLCAQISTKNYQLPKYQATNQTKICIQIHDSIDPSVSFLPIFPINKQYCYLYSLQDNTYEIQEFEKLDFLPAFPKSVVLWNGDIHLIGGTNSKEEALKTHIVFRSSTAEVFKLANIPVNRNPVNGLVAKKKQIYMIGGLNDKKQWETQCYCYNLQKKQWNEIASMKHSKPHQSCSVFNEEIYCFGIPVPNNINIEHYNPEKNIWKQIKIANFLSNPFNFAAGFTSIQINTQEILLFGGKKYIENLKNKKRSTDRQLTPQMYIFQPYNQSFVQLGSINPCIGVRDGEVNPVIKNGKIYSAEYLISKTQPICRWLSSINILQITDDGKAESVMILHED